MAKVDVDKISIFITSRFFKRFDADGFSRICRIGQSFMKSAIEEYDAVGIFCSFQDQIVQCILTEMAVIVDDQLVSKYISDPGIFPFLMLDSRQSESGKHLPVLLLIFRKISTCVILLFKCLFQYVRCIHHFPFTLLRVTPVPDPLQP